MDTEDLKKRINAIVLFKLEGIKIGDVLHYAYEYKKNYLFFAKLLYHFLYKTMFWNNCFEVRGVPRTLFLFSASYRERTDMLKLVKKVASTINDHVIMISRRTKKPHANFLRHLPLIFVWNRQLKDIVEDWHDRWHYIDIVYGAYLDYQELMIYLNKKGYMIANLITLYDAHCVDSLFTQMFNRDGKVTATLQHGFFSAKYSEWAFRGSHSNVFIANSLFSLDEAKKCGVNIDKYKIAGLPSYIDINTVKQHKDTNVAILGVVLDGEPLHDYNVQMLNFIQKFCKGKEYDIFIKLHPTSSESDYKEVIDYSLKPKIYGKEISIIEFGKLIDIGIIRNSTALLEMYMQYIPTFVFYSSEMMIDVYESLTELRFNNDVELQDKIEQVKSELFQDTAKKYKEYFGGYDNIRKRYEKIFNALCYNER